MSVIFTDGFDMYNGTNAGTGLPVRWTGGQIGTTTGRFGGQCMSLNSFNGGDQSTYATFDGTGTTTAMTVGFAFQTDTLGSDHVLHILGGSLGLQCGIGMTAAGALTIFGTTFGSPFATSATGLITVNTWYYLELEVVLNASTGSMNLYLGGTSIASASSVNTLPAGTGAACVQPYIIGGGFHNHYFDDMYITSSASHLGERRIETLRPASDNTAVWTPNSGATNYSRVNETLVDGDTSYVQTASTGIQDWYTIGSLSSTPTTIDAVNVVSFAEKTDATTRQLYNSMKSSSTTDTGAAKTLLSSYSRFEAIRNTDPATSAAWTASGVNNLLIGPKAA